MSACSNGEALPINATARLMALIGCAAFVVAHHRFALARHIDVRSGCQSLSPEAHGTFRIELLRGTERADTFSVIEAEGKNHALVEIASGTL